MDKAAIRSATRKGLALGAYRGLLNMALLVALFHAFPEYEAVSILAVLAFSQGVAVITLAMRSLFTIQNALDDSAERKTRHAILLAADPEGSHLHEFWSEVDRRVAAEFNLPEPSPWWAQIGLTLASFAGLVAGDIAAVIFALVIASATQ